MAILTLCRVIIDLSNGPNLTISRETDLPSLTLHFVNTGSLDKPAFELRQGKSTAYRLSPQESLELVRLMHAMTISAPRTPVFAFDGMTSELLIQQHGSDMSFRWHVERPREWESIGQVFEYAASFHNRLTHNIE